MMPLMALHGLASLSIATVTAPTISGARPVASTSSIVAIVTFGNDVAAMASGIAADSPS